MAVDLSKKKVLIVDDMENIRMMLTLVCEEVGCQIETANNGQQAFRAITRNEYDLILLDIMMPEWDGVTTIKGLDFYNVNPKIIVISGYISEELREELSEIELVNAIVNKPFKINDMRELITKHLSE